MLGEVKVGDWYRSDRVTVDAALVRAVELPDPSGAFAAVKLTGERYFAHVSDREPWAPRAGDWVRWDGELVAKGFV